MAATSSIKTACSICHKRKVRCDFIHGRSTCSNCDVLGVECRPHQRKRRFYGLQRLSTTCRSPHENVASYCRTSTIDQNNPLQPVVFACQEPPDISAPSSGAHVLHRPSEASIEESYVGRTDILGQVPFSESRQCLHDLSLKTETDVRDDQVLRVFNASYQLPEPVSSRLVNLFIEFCWPWAPVTEQCWLLPKGRQIMPPLLLQSILLTGSRVSSRSTLAQSMDLYQKAKALFFYGDKATPLASVISAILLQWWSPTGPEQVSFSNSSFWVHIAAGIAHQIGLHREPPPGPYQALRRRIWWTIVTRDILISVGVGRPRILNLEDSNVLPPSITDFHPPGPHASLFVAYVEICRTMGEVAECRRRSQLSDARKRSLGNSLYRWLHQLPPNLQLFGRHVPKVPNFYSLESRQLHVVFFVTLIILTNAEDANTASATSLIAASFIASIFADFQQRGDLQRLGPIFAFHGLAAALSLLSAQKFSWIAVPAAVDFDKIYNVLQELAEKWGSARGLLEPLSAARQSMRETAYLDIPPKPVASSIKDLFMEFGPDMCELWELMDHAPTDCLSYTTSSLHTDQENNGPVRQTIIASEDVPESPQSLSELSYNPPSSSLIGSDLRFDEHVGSLVVQDPWIDDIWTRELGVL